MRIAAALVTALTLILFVVLAAKSPVINVFTPRGGIFSLGLSLAVANVGVWLSRQPQRSLNERFQFAAAAWVWLIVQCGAMAYLLLKL